MTESYLSRGLDYYKATMSQVEFEKIPDEVVTFELKNRGTNRLSEFCSPEELSARLYELQSGWQPEEIAYLAGLQNQTSCDALFSTKFLDYLMDNDLPEVEIGLDEQGDLTVRTTGAAPLVTFWETVVMSEINEIYFRNKLAFEGGAMEEFYAEGDRRLDEKIARLRERPDIAFSDFGTRRRFSYEWQRHVIERLARELPDNFVGTSNVFLAHKLGLKPIGTFAHELPMIYGALADKRGETPLLGHSRVLQDWQQVYRGDLSTALTDTFGSEFFFADFTPEQAARWKALRHDSGNPFDFGETVIEFYKSLEIDPNDKAIVFSDGLTIDTIIQLADHFKGRINIMFGWGTTLTNDLGLKPNNFVMKAVAVSETPTVKLSDVPGKHTGPETSVQHYERSLANVRSLGAEAWQRYCQSASAEPIVETMDHEKPAESLWKAGVNQTADAVILHGNRVRLIWRKKDRMWALPGGFVDDNEDSLHAARREAKEETDMDISGGDLVYSGRVDDPRNTTDRWIETDAYLFFTDNPHGQAGDDAGDICWAPLYNLPPLYGSHADIIAKAIERLGQVPA